MRGRAFILIFLMLKGGFLYSADTYIKQLIQNKAYVLQGQEHEASQDLIETWIDKNRMAVHGQGRSLIVLLDKKLIYSINHVQKTYVAMNIPVDIHLYFPESLERLMGQVAVSVTPTEEFQKFEKRNCRIYEVDIESLMVSMKMKVWATLDLPFDGKSFKENIFAELAKVNFQLSESAVTELLKIEGFHYRTETSLAFMGAEMESIREVVEIDRKSAPDNIYDLPKDYERKDRFTLQDLFFFSK